MLVSGLQKTSASPQRVFKVVFLGSSGVGKTSFIHRFCTGQLQRKTSATVGKLCFHSHSVFSVTQTRNERVEPGRYRLPDEDFNCGLRQRHSAALGHSRAGEVNLTRASVLLCFSIVVRLLCWGYTLTTHSVVLCLFRFCSITEQYYRKADGILAMYDLTQAASFTTLKGWMHSVRVSRSRAHGRFGWKAKHAKQFVLIWINQQLSRVLLNAKSACILSTFTVFNTGLLW